MRSFVKSGIVFGVIAALICIPFANSALADEYMRSKEPGGGAMIYDLLAVRTTGIVATAVGAVFWVVTLPFSALGDNIDQATEKLVKAPARYTFKRPIGEF